MPVTARLSRAFYDRLGEDIAGELVAWFNDVDATYRADLRELNELNFARFDAKLEQRLAQFKADIDRRFVEFEARLEVRFAAIDGRFAAIDGRFAAIDARFALQDANIDKRFAEQDERLGRRLTEMERRLITRMYLLWGGSLIAQLSLTMALLKFVR